MVNHKSCPETDFFLLHQKSVIPLCIGICHTWNRCTSPTPCKTTSTRGEMQMTSQENNGKAVTQWPTRKASLGWINRKLQLLPWTSTRAVHRRGVKTLGKVMWPWTLEGTCMWGRGNDVKALLTCWWIVNPKSIWPLTKLGHMVGKAKWKGGVKWVSTPMSGGMMMSVCLPDVKYSHPPEEGPSATHRGVASNPRSKRKKNQI